MEMINQRVENVGNLENVGCFSFYQNFVSAGNDSALWKSRRELIDVFVLNAQKVDQGNIVEGNAFSINEVIG